MKSIAISIICKNEIQHVERIIEETRRADHIYILDTGSTDGTFEKLKENIYKKNLSDIFTLQQKHFSTYDFSLFRNEAKKMISEEHDYIFYLDMDESIGLDWRKILAEYLDENSAKIIILRLELPEGYITKLPRIFINKPGFWERPLHENFEFENSNYRIQAPLLAENFIVRHFKSNSYEKNKKYSEIIINNLNSDPENFLYFFFENIYAIEKNYDKYLHLYYEKKNFISNHLNFNQQHLLCRYAIVSRLKLRLQIDSDLFFFFSKVKNKSVFFNMSVYYFLHGDIEKAKESFRVFEQIVESSEIKFISYLPNAYTDFEINEHRRKLNEL